MTGIWEQAAWAGKVTNLAAVPNDGGCVVTVGIGEYIFNVTLPADHQPPFLGEQLEVILRRTARSS